MFIPAIVDYFKFKVVGSIFIVACWSPIDEIKLVKEFSSHGMSVTFACDTNKLEKYSDYSLQGVLYIGQNNHTLLEKADKKHFSHLYKWLIVTDEIPDVLHGVRYDCDIAILREEIQLLDNDTLVDEINGTNIATSLTDQQPTIFYDDIYVHPRDGATQHEWAHWTPSGLQLTRDLDRILRRRNVRQYPFRIAVPVSRYSAEHYRGSFLEYLEDMTVQDSAVRCGFHASSLLIDAVNAKRVLLPVRYYASDAPNSTKVTLGSGAAELGAGVLRVMEERFKFLDFVLPIWRFSVGFTYLAERESSSNMYIEPFTGAVWWSCLAIGITLAIAQRIASRQPVEKEGAYMTVLATWLQQDAFAVPDGISGRWTFTVLSICSMLVHAYYTSAIVSAFMSTGRGGPKNLRALADSRYAIASEDHDFIRNIMFNVKTDREDLEYLKKKKMTSKFYQEMKVGIQLVQQGSTAYHAEYHQLYHNLDVFSDEDICKLQYVDTIPESMAWVSTSSRGQWTNILRSAGALLFETGLARRLLSHMEVQPPPCRVALLAEKVTFWDIAPLLGLTTLGAVAALGLLGLEIIVSRFKKTRMEVQQ